MNVRRFVGRNAREAMAQVRAAWGENAVVLSNRPVTGGVEILAMPGADVPAPAAAPARSAAQAAPVEAMSTLSFQDFVRDRQRQDATAAPAAAVPRPPREPAHFAAQALSLELATPQRVLPGPPPEEAVVAELRAMGSMLAAQLSGLTWFDSVRRNPEQAQLLRTMLGNGFSPRLARQVVDALPPERKGAQVSQWLLDVLSHNLRCATGAGTIVERGGVHALVGPTGVGKTTTTAKLAAAFAMKHGAASVGLITVDTYRMAASDQLRAFGRPLGIPVHTAGDGAALAELLGLFSNKKLVLVDTVGIGQRDRRLRELFDALPEGRVSRLLVLNAAAQAETLEEVVQAYGAGPGSSCVVTKLDEAARCAGVIDVAIRHRLVVEGFANGQRVPEDWHAARAPLLVQKALLKPRASAFDAGDAELALAITAPHAVMAAAPKAARA